MRTLSPLSLSFGFAAGLVGACVSYRADPNHCQNAGGDTKCAELYPDGSRPFCSLGTCGEKTDGCEEQRPDDDCYSPCGDEALVDDPDCEGVADTSDTEATATEATDATEPTTNDPTTAGSMSASMTGSETETETVTDSSTGPSGCATSDECTDADNPICVDMACVPCTSAGDGDAECADKDPNAPACRDDGHCVQCTSLNDAACEDTTPVCNPDASSCEGCGYHSQCDAACDVVTGACFDGGVVLYVDGDDGACDDEGAGTMAMPYCSIQPAIDAVADGGSGVVIVAAEAAPYNGSLSVDGGKTIAVLGTGALFPVVTPSVGSTLTLTGADTNLYVEGLRFASNNSAVALSLSAGEVVLDRVEVVQNLGNGSGILVSSGAHLRLRNSVVGANGGNLSSTSYGISVDGATFDIVYATVAANDRSGAMPASLRCSGGGAGTIRNSIIVGIEAASVDCAGAEVTNSALDEDLGGMGNELVGALDAGWFGDVASGDFHLTVTGEGVFADVAVWESGDPPVDLDNEPRPNVDGTPDVAGADLP